MTYKYWNCNWTWPRRYDHFGTTGYALSYLERMDEATMIDVGCSTGEALSECKKCLAKHGVHIHTIGIDISGKVAKKAKKNLDEFVGDDVLGVSAYEGQADIVLCMNVERFVSSDIKSRIMEKCAWFLNEDGMLITGVKPRYRKRLNLEQPSTMVPEIVCRGEHLTARLGDLLRPIYPKDTRMMSRNEALHYVEMLRSD